VSVMVAESLPVALQPGRGVTRQAHTRNDLYVQIDVIVLEVFQEGGGDGIDAGVAAGNDGDILPGLGLLHRQARTLEGLWRRR